MISYPEIVIDVPVIVIGCGGHSGVLINTLRECGVQIIGVTDITNQAMTSNGVKVIGNDEVIFQYPKDEIRIVNGIGSLPGDNRRLAVSQKMDRKGYEFLTVIDPTACIAKDVQIGQGSQIMAGVVLQTGIVIGKGTVVNTGSIVDHDCNIGIDSWISPGVTLCGRVTVGEHAYIGAGSTVIQDIHVADNATVGAGSTILRNVECAETVIQKSYDR